ncbi:MAG: hypothetical protein HOC93_04670, partial [Phycisphaerae bacterium]|nr:hypothetical protein [Phycisphaerae bacterium]
MYKVISELNFFASIYKVAKAVLPTTKVSFSFIVTSVILAATSIAPATFVDLHLVQISTGTPSTGYTTYRLYAEFDDPNDQVTLVHGNTLPQSQISFGVAPNEFYQNPFCGPLAQHSNPAFWAAFPEMVYDSWVTIGAGPEDYPSVTSNVDFALFEAPINIGFFMHLTELSTPVNDPFNYGVTVSGLPNYNVLLGQFTTNDANGAPSPPFGMLHLAGYQDSFLRGEPQVEWEVIEVPFGDLPSNTGACCSDSADGWACQDVTENFCDAIGGTWHNGETCTNIDCSPEDTAACCYGDADCNWYCEMLTNDDCAAIDGLFYNTFTCDTISCVDPNYGACCYENAAGIMTCVYTNLEKCDFHYFGIWHPETPCDCVCDETNGLGACCYEDPDLGWTCIWTDLVKCDKVYFGTWYANTPCSQIDCPPISDQGACCYDDPDLGWHCIDNVSSIDCESIYNGTWYANTPCSQIDCPPIINDEGACCYEDIDLGWQCVWTDQGECKNGFLGTWYAGIPCIDIDCPPFTEEGACCYPEACDWACVINTPQECSALLGTYYPNLGCADISCPNLEFGECCYWEIDTGQMCEYTDDFTCTNTYNGTWYQGYPCGCHDCEPTGGDLCEVIASPNCVGPPQYPYPDYTIFGNGHIAIQTASTSILGGSTIMLFDLSGTLPVDTAFPLNRYSHPSWGHPNNDPAPDMGSIFGLAVDEAGNIYVTTSQTWNNDVVGSYGWGAVYKVDTNTAIPELFATIPMPNSESGLGSITYDCEHSQFFVSSFEDGIIYQLDYTTGAITGTFDHGNIYTGNSGPAPLGDRPWALEVHGDYLYYSLWNEHQDTGAASTANEIWSVALDVYGDPILGTSQLEISLPAYSSYDWSSPVSDIDFSPEGTMFVSERNQTSFTTLLAHKSRLLEYECTTSGWILTTNQYSVGISSGTNTAGGVDATNHGIWTSGDALHFATGDYIYGFQGIPLGGGNTTTSVLVDYQDDLTGSDKTMIGDIVVTDEDGGSTDGACCYPEACDWVCVINTPQECSTLLGTYYPNMGCADISCPNLEFGECCYWEIDTG